MHGFNGSDDKYAHGCSVSLVSDSLGCLFSSPIMDEDITSQITMKPAIDLPKDPSAVDYESEGEKQYSDLQLCWSQVMDKGPYKTSSTYTKVEVLLLCWGHKSSDLATTNEVDDLKKTFEAHFNYHVEIKYLDTTTEQRLQVRVNSIVAAFVDEHDGPHNLLIVYYAGHGRPGREIGDLELFGFVAHVYCIARLLTAAGKHHRMTRRSVWTLWYGTRLSNF